MKSEHSPRRRAVALGAALVSAALALALVATAGAAPIRGSVEVPRDYTEPTSEEGPARYYWEEWNGVLDPKPERLDVPKRVAVVLLGEAGEGGRPESFVKLHGGALAPSTMVMQAGSTLRIQNTDSASHELFTDGIEGFTALQTAPGNARTVSLPGEAGHFVVKDAVYPHVEGHLHVVTNLAARAEVNSRGQYEFEDVAPGTYTLKVFFDEREVHSTEVEVPQRELTIDPVSLDLSADSQ